MNFIHSLLHRQLLLVHRNTCVTLFDTEAAVEITQEKLFHTLCQALWAENMLWVVGIFVVVEISKLRMLQQGSY